MGRDLVDLLARPDGARRPWMRCDDGTLPDVNLIATGLPLTQQGAR